MTFKCTFKSKASNKNCYGLIFKSLVHDHNMNKNWQFQNKLDGNDVATYRGRFRGALACAPPLLFLQKQEAWLCVGSQAPPLFCLKSVCAAILKIPGSTSDLQVVASEIITYSFSCVLDLFLLTFLYEMLLYEMKTSVFQEKCIDYIYDASIFLIKVKSCVSKRWNRMFTQVCYAALVLIPKWQWYELSLLCVLCSLVLMSWFLFLFIFQSDLKSSEWCQGWNILQRSSALLR